MAFPNKFLLAKIAILKQLFVCPVPGDPYPVENHTVPAPVPAPAAADISGIINSS